MTKKVVVTGVAGFIGAALAQKLLAQGFEVYGCDNLNAYYAVSLKMARLSLLQAHPNFHFSTLDIAEKNAFFDFFARVNPQICYHLAAQAGVRYSLEAPDAYVQSNLVGSLHILEACRNFGIEHLLFASSSSVYGANTKVPFCEDDQTDHPVSLYAATKKSCEMMAHSYAHLFAIPTSMLRFFTVYGPWGRPDMAVFKFAQALANNTPIDLYGNGSLQRDYTYIDDVSEALMLLMDKAPSAQDHKELTLLPSSVGAGPFAIYNIGNQTPLSNLQLVHTLEEIMGKKVIINHLDKPSGDVDKTFASVEKLKARTGFEPKTELKEGLTAFVKWLQTHGDVLNG